MKQKVLFILLALSAVTCWIPFRAQAQQIIVNLPPDEFLVKIEQTPNAQILDLRVPEDYTYDHIPGAVNIEPTQHDFLRDVKDQLGASDTIFIYCRVGKPVGVDELLIANGYNVVYNMKGGSLAWESYKSWLAKEKKKGTAEQNSKAYKKANKNRKEKKPKDKIKQKWYLREYYIGTC